MYITVQARLNQACPKAPNLPVASPTCRTVQYMYGICTELYMYQYGYKCRIAATNPSSGNAPQETTVQYMHIHPDSCLYTQTVSLRCSFNLVELLYRNGGQVARCGSDNSNLAPARFRQGLVVRLGDIHRVRLGCIDDLGSQGECQDEGQEFPEVPENSRQEVVVVALGSSLQSPPVMAPLDCRLSDRGHADRAAKKKPSRKRSSSTTRSLKPSACSLAASSLSFACSNSPLVLSSSAESSLSLAASSTSDGRAPEFLAC